MTGTGEHVAEFSKLDIGDQFKDDLSMTNERIVQLIDERLNFMIHTKIDRKSLNRH
jgi:hypothetical protein